MGEVEHALDAKSRLVVPARFRERLGPGFVLTIARGDACLSLYPAVTWDVVCEQMEAAAVKDRRYWQFVRKINAYTEEAECDAQGRLLIPPKHRAYAGIEREVVSIGMLKRVEIWAKERRVADQAASADDAAAFAAFAEELGLP